MHYIVLVDQTHVGMAKQLNEQYDKGYRLVSYTPTWYYERVGAAPEYAERHEIQAVMERQV